ncbi:MAG: helix-turn-helix transcriptional regulator [Parvularculaceae bacterium]
MANNIKKLRLAFLLSPREFSRLIGIYPDYLPRLESGQRALTDGWIEAVSAALNIAPETVLDPDANIAAIAARAERPNVLSPAMCPIGVRFAILALVAKIGGIAVASKVNEDNLADAVCNLIAFVGGGERRLQAGKLPPEMFNRLLKGLQITALSILQSCADDPPPDFQDRLDTALPGAAALIEAFSQIDELARAPEIE